MVSTTVISSIWNGRFRRGYDSVESGLQIMAGFQTALGTLLVLLLLLDGVSGAVRRRGGRRRWHKDGVEYEAFDEDGVDDPGNEHWIESHNLTSWYTGFDLCMLSDRTNNTVESIMGRCEAEATKRGETLLPMRCRAGNSWPSKGEFCSSEDIPFAQRKNLQRAIVGYDDPTSQPLRNFFQGLANERSALLLVGDSVMQQFYGAMACELEREGLWTDPNNFKDTDSIKFVEMPITRQSSVEHGGQEHAAKTHGVRIKFLPIYHFVNGRWDRQPNASMHNLRTNVEELTTSEDYDGVTVLLNMGLHFVSNPVAQFTREDYLQQMSECLIYLNRVVLQHPLKKIRIIWRETSAQHFPTPNGYWPGQRYAADMKLRCSPIRENGTDADWRNADIRHIIASKHLNEISIIPFYNVTLPLWSSHVNGHLRDCTHFCWSPMLYQSIFHDLAGRVQSSLKV